MMIVTFHMKPQVNVKSDLEQMQDLQIDSSVPKAMESLQDRPMS